MGPLVPQGIIGDEWNYVVAFVIGIAFGAVLEASGFSSSRKLAGTFYGYDFTVVKVFFTAAVTAMTGLIYFNYFGWMDGEMVYVNPLYLQSAIVGGIVMGFGFIMGGFCPGTGICALAIGKIDAAFFVIGIIGGVFLFGETYPLWENIYTSNFLGSPRVFDTIGFKKGVFAFFLMAFALAAFFILSKIEKKSKPIDY